MKTKSYGCLFVLFVVLFLVGSINVYGATKTTAFQIQNLASTPATITIKYFDSTGTEVTAATETAIPIAANDSIQRAQSNNTNLPAGFNGSVVIESDQPIAAIANQDALEGTVHYQGSYTGIDGAATASTFFLPVALKTYFGYTTEISIQNAGSANVDVTIHYFDDTGAEIAAAQDTKTGLLPGGAVRFSQGSNANLPANFNGSAKAVATGPIVAVVNQDNTTAFVQQTYNGFGSGNATLYIPVVMNSFFGFNTAFQIQNVGTVATDIKATYSDGTEITRTGIGPGQAAMFVQSQETHSSNYAGSAVITASQPIVGIVNQASAAKASSYNAFTASATNFILPAVMKAYFSFNSAFQCLNVGAATADITATFTDGVVVTQTGIGVNSPAQFVQANEGHASNWAGGVKVTSTQPIVCIVNQEGPNGVGDNSMSYNGVPSI